MANTWIFAANPKYYDVRAALGNCRQIPWRVRQHADAIRLGDRAYVWQMGTQAAILAQGEVVTEVGPVKLDPGDPFILDRDQFPNVEPSVYLLIEKVFRNPIQKAWLQMHPKLKSLSVLHPPYQRTNFSVESNEAKVLDALARQAAGIAALSDVHGS